MVLISLEPVLNNRYNVNPEGGKLLIYCKYMLDSVLILGDKVSVALFRFTGSDALYVLLVLIRDKCMH